jgi:hypothetical protein
MPAFILNEVAGIIFKIGTTSKNISTGEFLGIQASPITPLIPKILSSFSLDFNLTPGP